MLAADMGTIATWPLKVRIDILRMGKFQLHLKKYYTPMYILRRRGSAMGRALDVRSVGRGSNPTRGNTA